jgi:hypothetical protein
MRRAPYPASEDALLERTFGRAAVRGRTVLCAGADGDWNVVVVQDGAGAVFLLECTRDPAGATVLAISEADQSAFARVFERAGKAAAERDLDIADWVDAERAVAAVDPDFDFDVSMATWGRIEAAIAGRAWSGQAVPDFDAIAAENPDIAEAMAELIEQRAAGMRPN